jgi:S1-C subfamily serine protease
MENEFENLTPPRFVDTPETTSPDDINRQSLKSRTVAFLLKVFSRINLFLRTISGWIALSALAIGVLSIVMAFGPYQHYNKTDPANDGFVQPRSIQNLVDRVQASTVTVFCDYSKDSYMQGSGWAINLPIEASSKYQTTLITNHHVIKKCLDGTGKVAVKTLGGKEYSAYVDRWDAENDLAVVGTVAKVPALQLSQWMPYAGYWVMAVGTADGYEGSVAFGNVLNITDTDVLITAPISHGNSGGPLVDNEGNVVGTNAWGAKGEQYNGAISLDAMCIKIMKCTGKYFWSRS